MSAASTCCTPRSVLRPNAATRCSRPPSRRCAGSACARGASARSPPPPWSCFTTCTTAQHDQRAGRVATGKGSLRKGLEVVAVGQMADDSYETEAGEKRRQVVVEAPVIAPSLRFAKANVMRVQREQSAPEPDN